MATLKTISQLAPFANEEVDERPDEEQATGSVPPVARTDSRVERLVECWSGRVNSNIYNGVNLSIAWDNQLIISGRRVSIFSCPSDPKSNTVRDPGGGKALLYPTTCGFNLGTWFVFNPTNGLGSDGAFYSNSNLNLGAFLDGTSNTLLASECDYNS